MGESQCPYLSIDGLKIYSEYVSNRISPNCPRHAGRPVNNLKRQHHALQLSGLLSQDIDRLSNHEASMSLRAEVAIVRRLLETTLNRCSDSTLLEANSGRVLDLIKQLESLVKSAANLEKFTNETLSAGQAASLVSGIAEIVMEHVSDPDILEAIQRDIQTLITGEN